MSGADYTRTPNLGLYKPNYALDVGQWGNHLNHNADVLDELASSDANVLGFGAVCDGTTDDTAAVGAALNSGARRVTIPAGQCCFVPGGLTVPVGVSLEGLSFHANNPQTFGISPPSSSILTNANINSVTLASTPNGDVQGASLSNLVVATNAVSAPTAGAAVYASGGYNVHVSHVMAYNAYDGFCFKATGASGISGFLDHCASGKIAGHHIVQDTWPELRVNMCRFGMNGSGDLGALAYCYLTGGVSGNILPNGLFVTNCQFNEAGASNVGAMLSIGNMVAGAGASAQEVQFDNCHIEHCDSFVKTDATVTFLATLKFIGCTMISQTGNFWALNSALGFLAQSQIMGCHIDTATFHLGNLTMGFWEVQIAGNSIYSDVSLTSGNGAATLAFVGNGVFGNLSLAGVWGGLMVDATVRGTFSNAASGNARVNVPGFMFQSEISAAGTTQATATAITGTTVSIKTGAASSGVRLSAFVAPGTKVDILNVNTVAHNVYPPFGWTIFGGSPDIARSLPSVYRLTVVANPTGSQYLIEYSGPMVAP